MPSVSSQPEFLTRPELVSFLRSHGFPVARSTIDKLAMPSRGRNDGPPIAGFWGNRALYRPAAALRWARSRFRARATPSNAA
jgi:hypothetical protein